MVTKNKKNKLDIKYNLSVYFNFLKNYKFLFGIIIFVGLLLEASRVIDKFLFKVIIDNGTEFAAGTLAKQPFIQILLIVLVVFFGAIIFKFIFNWLHLHLVNRLFVNLILDLKRKFFNHLIFLSHSFHISHKTGSMISRLTRSGGAMERMTDVLIFSVFPLIFQLVIVSVSLIYFSWQAVLVVIGTVIVFLTYSFVLQSRQLKHSIEANKTEDIEKGNVADFFTNIDSIKYFGKEKSILGRFRKLTESTRKAWLRAWDYFRWMDAGQSLILGLGTFFVVYFPLISFLNGEITIGTLVFVYTIFGNIFWPLFSFIHGVRNFYRAMSDFEGLFEYGKIENEIKDKPGAEKLRIKKGEIEFKNMSFDYGKRNIFKNFNLKIPKNKKIAFVGHSGSGKTTLVKLLHRFYDVIDGAILIDGWDIRNVTKESLRNEMSMVPQECILFDDTIYQNIAFSRPGATKQEIMQAIKFAQLDKIIQEFPKKENTIVGERGVKLSGGEKQRVSIARAILANKKVLVLDEATSSLDSETEHEI
ncbi:MAG TPA: ABC transporter ATP-binding protein, partial [Candidatus Paceibacterota bacterium]|nr:ABC transporter ATP-binding protein [Candidatus Paceibacterota bacterium]